MSFESNFLLRVLKLNGASSILFHLYFIRPALFNLVAKAVKASIFAVEIRIPQKNWKTQQLFEVSVYSSTCFTEITSEKTPYKILENSFPKQNRPRGIRWFQLHMSQSNRFYCTSFPVSSLYFKRHTERNLGTRLFFFQVFRASVI